ncbi:hypothetical protein [Novosphingobium sp. PY1]|uniref:hypothetical protein n=1 Tax=Novosphingobium sp. PY1 TaxID=1882221 RepID=UPI001A8C3CFB|nr:hypothetical protein [Novosphingobium sp. PY1]GFM30714.1 cation-transporting P-type ATPase [Novosphingobium sp. PY1]
MKQPRKITENVKPRRKPVPKHPIWHDARGEAQGRRTEDERPLDEVEQGDSKSGE